MLPHALHLILLAWVCTGLALIGLGLACRRMAGAPVRGAEDLLRSVWVGWAALLILLQVWHLFLPVDDRAAVACGVLGAIGVLTGGWRPWWGMVRGTRRHWLVVPALLFAACWLADRAMGGPRFGDVGLYHIPVIRWNRDYPIVPGLGNVFVPFGHNQSYFLYVALLEVGPFAGRSYHVANSILVLALLAQGLLGASRVLQLGRGHGPADVFYALLLPVVLLEAAGIFLTSPSPDQPLFLLGIVLSGELIRFAGRRGRAENLSTGLDGDLVVLALLVTAAITVKMQIGGHALAVLGVALLLWVWRERPAWRRLSRTLAAMTAVAVGGGGLWIAGNVILTGRPLFPSAVAALPVEWRVDVDAVHWINQGMSFGAPVWVAIRNWPWFLRRLESLGWHTPIVIIPVVIAAGATALAVVLRLLRRRPATPRVPMLVLLPLVVSFGFIFAYTPMPRYMGSTLWVLAASSVVVMIGGAAFGGRAAGRVVIVALAVAGAAGVLAIQRPLLLGLRTFQPRPAPRVEAVQLASGLVVYVPGDEEGCWDAPPPCTPEPHPRLRLRRPGNLDAGFVIDATP